MGEMSKPDDIPQDIWEIANDTLMGGPLTHIPTGLWLQQQAVIARAIFTERERCVKIMYAEREWGGELVEACSRIESGEPPRVIPGWNAPSED